MSTNRANAWPDATRPRSKHFRGLDGARALAACAIIPHHVEQIKHLLGLPSAWLDGAAAGWVYSLGRQGVEFFFVLSGFLITTLLLGETAARGDVDIRGFYKRRGLRILPLYYAVVLFAFLCMPLLAGELTSRTLPFFAENIHALEQGYWLKFLVFLAALPALGNFFHWQIWFVTQTWSVGIELLLYLIWPWMIRLTQTAASRAFKLGPLPCLLALVAGKWCLVGALRGQIAETTLIYGLPIDAFAAGGIAACLHLRHRDWVDRVLVQGITQWVTLPLFLGLLAFGIGLNPCGVLSIAYACLLLDWVRGGVSSTVLDFKPIAGLGRISYGIYMLQPQTIIFVFFAIRILVPLDLQQGWAFNVVLYSVVFGSVVGLAKLSSRFFESRFKLPLAP